MVATPIVSTKPRLSTGFKVFLGIVALVLIVFAGARFIGALSIHHDVKAQAKNQVEFIQLAIVTPSQGLAYGLEGVNGLHVLTMGTSAKRVGTRDFMLTVTGSDGYTSHYDSRTNFFTGGCTNLACWFN